MTELTYVPIVIFVSWIILLVKIHSANLKQFEKIPICRKLKCQDGIGIRILHRQYNGDAAPVDSYLLNRNMVHLFN